MRIAHLTTVHPRHDTRIMLKMAGSLVRAGHAVSLYVADGLGSAVVDGVSIIDIGKPANRLHRAGFCSLKMWAMAIQGKHDILHCHDPELIPGALACRLSGTPILYDIHEYYRSHLEQARALPGWLKRLLVRVYGLAERSAARWLDGCVVVTPHMAQVLPLRVVVVVENAVRADEFHIGDTPHGQRPAMVCYVGVLARDRQVGTMVEAARLGGTRLELAGRWYPEADQRQVLSRGNPELVRWRGVIGRGEMQELFEQARAGLLILNLHGDEEHSSSNKLFEYMAAGLPVIASDLAFTRAVIQRHDCGLLVPADADAAAIAVAIRWLLEHPQEAERMGRAGRRAVEREYSWDRAFASLLALYGELLAGHDGGRRR